MAGDMQLSPSSSASWLMIREVPQISDFVHIHQSSSQSVYSNRPISSRSKRWIRRWMQLKLYWYLQTFKHYDAVFLYDQSIKIQWLFMHSYRTKEASWFVIINRLQSSWFSFHTYFWECRFCNCPINFPEAPPFKQLYNIVMRKVSLLVR